jgi:hypothetical protein
VGGHDESAYHKVQQTGSELTRLNDLNRTSGVSNESFSRFLHQESTTKREEATYPLIIQQRRCETENAQLSKGKRCTAGVYVCAEGHHFSRNALEIAIRANERNEQKMLATMDKKKTERDELRQKVVAVLIKVTQPSCWNVDNHKNMVKWFKRPSDPALPTRRQELIEIYDHMKLITVRDTCQDGATFPLPTDYPIPAASVPTLQALTNDDPMSVLSIDYVINPTVDLTHAPILAPAPAVAADFAPAAAAGETLPAADNDTLY